MPSTLLSRTSQLFIARFTKSNNAHSHCLIITRETPLTMRRESSGSHAVELLGCRITLANEVRGGVGPHLHWEQDMFGQLAWSSALEMLDPPFRIHLIYI